MSRNQNPQPRAVSLDLAADNTSLTTADTRARGTVIAGKATLVDGTVTVSVPGLPSGVSNVQVTPSGLAGTIGVCYSAFAGDGVITITSHKADKTTETLDTSTLNYLIIV